MAIRRRIRVPLTVLPVGFLLLGAGVLFGELGLDRTDKVSSAIGALTGLVGLLFSVPSLVKDRTEKPSAGQALPVQSRPAVIPARAVDSIPRDVADFVDREKALAKIEARAYGRQSAGVTACVISGMAGVGKTTLAVRAASRLASSYPDSRLFLNLHAYSRDRPPLSPGGALDALLRAFGVQPERIPDTVEERAALWRTETRNSHTLILLDNVEGPEQIVPLLPASPTCMIIATSRRRIVLDGACTVFLDSLDTGNAVQLMEKVVGSGRIERDPRSITAVVGRCGGLPLALRLVAKHFECHPTWEPRHLLAELSDRQNRNILVASGHGGLVATFELSYEGLTSGQQRMLRRLALHPSHDFSIHAAVALSGGNADDARVVLDSLFDHSLVEEPQHGRYQIHDLVREFVKARTFVEDSAEEREEALNRLIDYYIAVTSRSEKMINLLGYRDKTDSLQWTPPEMPALASHEEAADWIETERPNLHACIQIADDIGQRTRAVRLARSMLYFLRLKGYWAEASELCVRSIEWCIELEDVACAADMRFLAGDIARLTGDQERALRFYGEALGGYQELGDRFLEARTLHSVGDLERTERRYDEALEVYSRALAVYRDLGNELAEARALHSMSDTHRLAHRTQEALANYETVLDIYQRLGDPVGQVRVLHSIGDIDAQAGRYEEALTKCRQALQSYETLGDRLGEADAKYSLATIHRLRGLDAEACHGLEDAADAYRSLGDKRGVARALIDLGAAHLAADRDTDAHTAYEEAASLAAEIDDRHLGAEAECGAGRSLLAGRRFDEGLSRLRAGLALLEALVSPEVEAVRLEIEQVASLRDDSADGYET